jgi:hypothetical protein
LGQQPVDARHASAFLAGDERGLRQGPRS